MTGYRRLIRGVTAFVPFRSVGRFFNTHSTYEDFNWTPIYSSNTRMRTSVGGPMSIVTPTYLSEDLRYSQSDLLVCYSAPVLRDNDLISVGATSHRTSSRLLKPMPDNIEGMKKGVKGVLTSVKNQKQTNTCWICSSVSCVEAYNTIVTGESIELPVQQIMDSSQVHLCGSGYPTGASPRI